MVMLVKKDVDSAKVEKSFESVISALEFIRESLSPVDYYNHSRVHTIEADVFKLMSDTVLDAGIVPYDDEE